MKNKKLIFAVLFAGVLALNTLVLSTNNNNDIQLNSLFTLASAQAEDGEDGELDPYTMYQTMAYCGSKINYACKVSYTAEKCRLYACLVNW